MFVSLASGVAFFSTLHGKVLSLLEKITLDPKRIADKETNTLAYFAVVLYWRKKDTDHWCLVTMLDNLFEIGAEAK
jgi:hypothetical protein